MMRGNHEKGALGESVARRFLTSRGHVVLESNWLVPGVGEIDIITMKEGVLNFVEVKSVTRESSSNRMDSCNPLENIDTSKIRSMRRTAELYLGQNPDFSRATFSVVSVTICVNLRTAHCVLIEDLPFA